MFEMPLNQSSDTEVPGLFGKSDQLIWEIASEQTLEKEIFLKISQKSTYLFKNFIEGLGNGMVFHRLLKVTR